MTPLRNDSPDHGLDSLLLLRLALRWETQEVSRYAEEQLLMASEHGEFEKVIALAKEGANVNARNGNGITPLMMAVTRRAGVNILRNLIENLADVNARDQRNDGFTILFLAISTNLDEASIQLLLDSGADIHATTTQKRRTAVMIAAQFAETNILNILLDRGDNLNAKDWKGRTALMVAAEFGKHAMVTHLIAKQADPKLLNDRGQSALHYAAFNGHSEIMRVLIPVTVLSETRISSLIHRVRQEKPSNEATVIEILQQMEPRHEVNGNIWSHLVPLEQHCERASLQRSVISIRVNSTVSRRMFQELSQMTEEIEQARVIEAHYATVTWATPFQILGTDFQMKCIFHQAMGRYEVTLASLQPIQIPYDEMPEQKKVKARKYFGRRACIGLMVRAFRRVFQDMCLK